jgi:hypothetical protein
MIVVLFEMKGNETEKGTKGTMDNVLFQLYVLKIQSRYKKMSILGCECLSLFFMFFKIPPT